MKNNNSHHTPVLLKEAIDALRIKKGNRYIDATLGSGGHTKEIIRNEGIVLGVDRDEHAIEKAKAELDKNENLKLIKGNFRDIKKISEENGFVPCSGILFDLGTSINQLKGENRGFSFNSHEELDMRMDTGLELTAKEIVNKWSKSELIDLLEKYGEENESSTIADEIIKRRKREEIIYADDLAKIISEVKKEKQTGINPATKVFQALRIAVNDELTAIKEALEDGVEILEKKGRIVVVSFHSLEDRIVKNKFRNLESEKVGNIITKKPIIADSEEQMENKRSRSAKMRIFEKN